MCEDLAAQGSELGEWQVVNGNLREEVWGGEPNGGRCPGQGAGGGRGRRSPVPSASAGGAHAHSHDFLEGRKLACLPGIISKIMAVFQCI